MKKILFCTAALLLMGCGFNDRKIIIKKVNNGDITIKWFYYSYITSNSPEFVTVEKGDSIREVYKAVRVIVNVSLSKDSIILRLVEPGKGGVYTKQIDKAVFGYKISLDSTGNYEEFKNVPDGKKEE